MIAIDMESVDLEVMTPYELHVTIDGLSESFSFMIVGFEGIDPRRHYSRGTEQDRGVLTCSGLLIFGRNVG